MVVLPVQFFLCPLTGEVLCLWNDMESTSSFYSHLISKGVIKVSQLITKRAEDCSVF